MRTPIWLDIVRTSGWLVAGVFFGLWMNADTIVIDRELEPPLKEVSVAYEVDPDRVYRATVVHVVDGDTVDVVVDQGFGNSKNDLRLRLYGINTPESYGVKKDSEEYKLGIAAKDWVVKTLRVAHENDEGSLIQYQDGGRIWFHSHKKGKFGRYLGVIWTKREDIGDLSKSVNAQLLTAGHAELYKNDPLPLAEDDE